MTGALPIKGASAAELASTPLTQAVGAHQPQQHTLTQAAISHDDMRRGPNPGDGGEHGTAWEHELDPIRPDARMQHQPLSS
jgi:hypothetical protein